MTGSDDRSHYLDSPLGLTPEQVYISEMHAGAEKLMAQLRRNAEVIQALPEGTTFRCGASWCTTEHPIEIIR